MNKLRAIEVRDINRLFWRKVAPEFRIVISAGWLLLLLIVNSAPVFAAATITQGYAASEKYPAGYIVSLVKNSSDTITAAKAKESNSIIGVVINDSNSQLAILNSNDTRIQVATTGTTQVLASDINGKIERGDSITASPIAGVGMKATDNVKVIGIAQGELENTSSQKYKDANGLEQTIAIGQLPTLINVSYFYKQPAKTIIPSAVQNVANAIANKSVNPLPIIISAGIFIVTIAVVASMIYAMIRNSIISVGRNPMSQSAVYRDLIQMSVLVLVILGIALGSIYMILTRF